MQSMKDKNLLKMNLSLDIIPSMCEGCIPNMGSRAFSPIAVIVDGEVEARSEDLCSSARLVFFHHPLLQACKEAFSEVASKIPFIDKDTLFPCIHSAPRFDHPFVQECPSWQHKDFLCGWMYAEQLLHERIIARVGSNGDGQEEVAVNKEVIKYFGKLRRLHDHNVGEFVEIMIEA